MRTRKGREARVATAIVGLVLSLGLSGCLFPTANRAPVLALDVSPREGYAPLDVVFDASGSFDPEGEILTIQWDFDDGDSGTGARVSHSYQGAGTYQIRVTVTDPEGKAASASIRVEVRLIPDGYTLRTFQWERAGEVRTWDMLIPYDLYQMYKGRLRVPYVDTYLYGDYVIDPLDDPTLHDYAMELWNRVGQDDDEFIQEVLAFVQDAISYQADPPGVDHPLYPLETLADGHGDCEDTAILLVSLLRAMDIQCKLAFVDTDNDTSPDHVLALVAVSDALLEDLSCYGDSITFTWGEDTFVIAETAAESGAYPLGCDPWGLDQDDLAELWSFPSM